jgi:hypothetical protein
MTIKTTVVSKDGATLARAYVSANIQNTGATFTRFTDGNGYADVALLDDEIPDGAQVTFLVQADGYTTHAEYLTIHDDDDDREVVVTLSPFV